MDVPLIFPYRAALGFMCTGLAWAISTAVFLGVDLVGARVREIAAVCFLTLAVTVSGWLVFFLPVAAFARRPSRSGLWRWPAYGSIAAWIAFQMLPEAWRISLPRFFEGYAVTIGLLAGAFYGLASWKLAGTEPRAPRGA